MGSLIKSGTMASRPNTNLLFDYYYPQEPFPPEVKRVIRLRYPLDFPFSVDWLKSHFRDVSSLSTLTKIAFAASAKHSFGYKILENRFNNQSLYPFPTAHVEF